MATYEIKQAYEYRNGEDVLELYQKTIDEENQVEYILLVAASYNEHIIIKQFLDKDEDIILDYIDGIGRNLLQIACSYKEVSNQYSFPEHARYLTTKLLLNNGLSAIKKDEDNRNATSYAVMHGNYGALKAFIEHGSRL